MPRSYGVRPVRPSSTEVADAWTWRRSRRSSGDEARRLGFAACGVTSVRPFTEARDPSARRDRCRPDGRDGLVHARSRRGVGGHRRSLPVGAVDRRARLAVSARDGADRRSTAPAARSRGAGSRPTRAPRTAAAPSTTTTSSRSAATRWWSGCEERVDGVACKAFRRPRMGARPRHRGAGRHRVRRQARVGDHPRGRLVRAARSNRRVGVAPGRRTVAARVRPLHRMHAIVSDRGDRRARRHRRPALHLLPHHRAPRADSASSCAP